jgi:hypothetical protein|tara:strand:+ start:68 stop:502 length:435 start_codon:yes stop_codon:yes gene_type:complete
MLQNRSAPNIPQAPPQYDVAYMNSLSNVIRLFFNTINTVQQLNLASLNLDLRTLPTDADFNNLRLGDVYRDTQDGVQAGSEMLRIKTASNVVFLTGVRAVGSVGAVGAPAGGVASSGSVGSVSPTRSVGISGVSAAGAVGTVTP